MPKPTSGPFPPVRRRVRMSPFPEEEGYGDQARDLSTPVVVDKYPDKGGDPSSGTRTFLIHEPDGPRLPPSSTYNPSVNKRTTWARQVPSGLVVLFDMDGVLADFDGAARKLIDAEGLPQPVAGTYDLLSDPVYKRVRDVVAGSQEFWDAIPPIEDGVLAFGSCGDSAYICSSPGFPASATPKILWCQKHLGIKAERVVLTPSKALLAGPDRLLVDDRADRCADFESAGGTSLLVLRPWSFDGTDLDDSGFVMAEPEALKYVLKDLGGLYSSLR